MIGIIGVLLSLALLMYLAYKGVSVIILAPLMGLLALLFNSGFSAHFMATYTEVYMAGFGNFTRNYFPLFVTGAIFAKLMDAADYTKSIAAFVANRLGKEKAILAVVLAGAILTYGGVSLFVVAFVVYPIAVSLFRGADIPKRLIPGSIALGAFTFTMTALPGTPQVQNTIPMAYFGTDSFAAPVLGLVAAVVMFGLGMLWLTRRALAAKAAGEGYGEHEDKVESFSLSDASKFPPLWSAVLPILVMIGLNLFFSKAYYVSADGSYLESFGTALNRVSGNWAVILALVFTSLLMLIVNFKKLLKNNINGMMKEGVANSFVPIISSSAVSGFGSVIRSVAAYAIIQQFVLALSRNPLISEALSVNLLCGLTASASGGLGAALEALSQTLIQMGNQAGIPMEVLHRVASVAAGGLDTLPFNGAVVTTLTICGLTHKQSYKDICATSVVIPIIATAVIVILASLGLRF
jgi:H+/gluconate symporter-like permease